MCPNVHTIASSFVSFVAGLTLTHDVLREVRTPGTPAGPKNHAWAHARGPGVSGHTHPPVPVSPHGPFRCVPGKPMHVAHPDMAGSGLRMYRCVGPSRRSGRRPVVVLWRAGCGSSRRGCSRGSGWVAGVVAGRARDNGARHTGTEARRGTARHHWPCACGHPEPSATARPSVLWLMDGPFTAQRRGSARRRAALRVCFPVRAAGPCKPSVLGSLTRGPGLPAGVHPFPSAVAL